MKDEEIYEDFNPLEWCYLGYISEDVWDSKDDGIKNTRITPVSVKHNNKWISNRLFQQIWSEVSDSDSIFAYNIVSKVANPKRNTLLEFYVYESNKSKNESNGGNSKYNLNLRYDVKPVSLPFLLNLHYSTKFEDNLNKRYFNLDSYELSLAGNIDGSKCYLRNIGNNSNRIVGPFKCSKQNGIYRLTPFTGKEVYAIHFEPHELENNTIDIEHSYPLILNEKDLLNKLDRVSVDCMTHKQLSDWFKNYSKNLTTIDEQYLETIKSYLKDDELNDPLSTARLQRIVDNIDQYIELDSLRENLEGYYDKYIESHKEIRDKIEEKILVQNIDLQNEAIELSQEIKVYANKISIKKQEFDSLEAKIEEKKEFLESSLKDLETEKINLEQDLDSLKNKIDIATKQLKNPVDVSYYTYDEVRPKTAEQMTLVNDIPLSYLMKNNSKLLDFSNELIQSFDSKSDFWAYKALFVPNVSWAYAYGQIIGKTKIATIYSEYDWLHYEDYKKAGLEKIWFDAHCNPEYIYILHIDGINISCPESGLRPLLDVIDGRVPTLGQTGLGFPSNLWIMASILPASDEEKLNNIGLQLRQNRFCHWGAIANPRIIEIRTGKENPENKSELVSFSASEIISARKIMNYDSSNDSNLEEYLAF